MKGKLWLPVTTNISVDCPKTTKIGKNYVFPWSHYSKFKNQIICKPSVQLFKDFTAYELFHAHLHPYLHDNVELIFPSHATPLQPKIPNVEVLNL